MGVFENKPWWRRSSEKLGDVEEKFLDSSSDGRDSCEEETGRVAEVRPSSPWKCSYPVILSVGNLVLFAGTALLATGFPWRVVDKNYCAQKTSSYAPFYAAKEVDYHTVHFNGTLYPGADPSWSRKEPGDAEAEAKWEEFEIMHTFPISRDDIIALGKDPETSTRYTPEFGLGDDAYVASLDVQHKIHCLNELRKNSFIDYGNETPVNKVHGQLYWIHLRHCVDMLLQDLTCHADADLITYRWTDTQDHAFPDFGLNRKCRKLDDLIAYRNEHRVDMHMYEKMAKPQGVKQVPFDPEYYAMYGFKDSDLFPNGEGYGPLPTTKFFGVNHKDGIPKADYEDGPGHAGHPH